MEEAYEVYGRGRKDDALWHLGMIRAVSGADAEVFAYLTFDEQKWVEMLIVPRARVFDADGSETGATAADSPRRFLVFARDDPERALECAGELEALDEDAARQRARAEHYGQVEMVLVPADAAHWIVSPAVAAEGGAQ